MEDSKPVVHVEGAKSFGNFLTDLQESPGDGYLGPTPIPNPIRLAQDAVDATNRKSAEKVKRINKILPGSASMPKHDYFNKGPSAASQKYLGLKNSYEPEGEVVEGRYSGGGALRPTDRIKMGDGSLKSLKDIDAELKKKKLQKESETIDEKSAAWTRKAGKNSEEDNEKGRKSYEKENPGSDLKAPSKEKGNPRRKSFCARMKGMKNKLTKIRKLLTIPIAELTNHSVSGTADEIL